MFAGAVQADYARSVEALQNGNYSLAALELSDLLQQGDPKAEYLMGFMYYHGMGVVQDYSKAFELFKDATEKGHIEAQTFLGYLYDEGKGTAVNKKRHLNYIRNHMKKAT